MQAWKGESYDLLSFMYVCGNKIIVIVIVIVVNKHSVFIELLPAAKHKKAHELYALSGLIQKSRKMRIVGYNDFATLLVPSHLQKRKSTGSLKYALQGLIRKRASNPKNGKKIAIVAYMLQFECFLSETYIWVCYPIKKMNLVMLLYKAGDKPSPEIMLTRCVGASLCINRSRRVNSILQNTIPASCISLW